MVSPGTKLQPPVAWRVFLALPPPSRVVTLTYTPHGLTVGPWAAPAAWAIGHQDVPTTWEVLRTESLPPRSQAPSPAQFFLIQSGTWIICDHRVLNCSTWFSVFLFAGQDSNADPRCGVPATSPAETSLRGREENHLENRKSPFRQYLVLPSPKPPHTDSDEEATSCAESEDSVTTPSHADICSESQVYLTIGEFQHEAGSPGDACQAGRGSAVGTHSLADDSRPGRSPSPEGGPDYMDVQSSTRPTVVVSDQHGREHFRDNCESDGRGAAGGRGPSATSSEKTTPQESRTLGKGAAQDGKMPPLKLFPGEACEPLTAAWRAPPKDPPPEEQEDLSVLSGAIKRSSSVISDSGIESEPSSVAWSEARSRALELPGEREGSHLLARRHALHRNSLEGGRTESNASLPSGIQASLTSISSLPFEEDERELALTKLTKSASAPQISSPEEAAEDTDAVRQGGGLPETSAGHVESTDPPGPCSEPRGGSRIQDSGASCPLVEVVSNAGAQQGPGSRDVPEGKEPPWDPPGSICRPDGRTETPPGVEAKGLNFQIPRTLALEGPWDGSSPRAQVGTPKGASARGHLGTSAPPDSGNAGMERLLEHGAPDPSGAPAAEATGLGSPGLGPPGELSSAPCSAEAAAPLEAGHWAGAACTPMTHPRHTQAVGHQEPQAGSSASGPPLAPAETFSADGLKAVEVVNLSVSCTATCLPFSSVPKETPARAGFSCKQAPLPITHQPSGSFGVVSAPCSQREEDVGERMFR